MKYPLIIFTFILQIIAWWYFITLLSRTDFFAGRTSIGNDVILIMYVLCALNCFFCGYLIYRKDIIKSISVAIFIAALLPAIGFLYMNLSGRVSEIKKAELNNEQVEIKKEK